MESSGLRATFNTVAALYEEMRPGYPEELVEDILDLSEIEARGRILEIGCGTGQATIPFAARGYEMTCLDIGSDLIEEARRRLNRFTNVSYILSTFEDWKPPGEFDLVISATAFRWVSPKVRYVRARDALRPGGALAIFSNQHVRRDEGFFAEVQEVYSKHYVVSDSPYDPGKPTPLETPEPGIADFSDPIQRVYPWEEQYSAEQYIKLVGTYSDHIALPESNRKRLFECIVDMINRNHAGSIIKHYQTTLSFRRKKD